MSSDSDGEHVDENAHLFDILSYVENAFTRSFKRTTTVGFSSRCGRLENISHGTYGRGPTCWASCGSTTRQPHLHTGKKSDGRTDGPHHRILLSAFKDPRVDIGNERLKGVFTDRSTRCGERNFHSPTASVRSTGPDSPSATTRAAKCSRALSG